MAAYGLNIAQVMEWTYPQLRLMAHHRRFRVRDDRRWQLMLASGTLSPEMWDELWYSLGGVKLGLKSEESEDSQPITTPTSGPPGHQAHRVDSQGNVLAPGAPLLSDIALGKAVAPSMIPIKVIDKGE